MKRCASVHTLTEIANVNSDTARKVRAAWRTLTRDQLIDQFPRVREYVSSCFNPPGTRLLRRMAIDSLIETHGVEYLGTHRRSGDHVYYCNSGDTYDATIVFSGDCLRVACYGDLIERGTVRERP
jgi:hypothetical protein